MRIVVRCAIVLALLVVAGAFSPVNTVAADQVVQREDWLPHRDDLPDMITLASVNRGRTPRAALATLTTTVHVIAIDTGDGSAGTSQAQAAQMVSRLNTEYKEETGDRYQFVMGTFQQTSVADVDVCDLTAMDERFAALKTNAIANETGSYTYVYVTPASPNCGYGGLAWLGNPGIHMNGNWEVGTPPANDSGSALDVHVFAHEVGHNLGLPHARAIAPTATDAPENGNGAVSEYGDLSDTMGSNYYNHLMNAAELDQIGVMPASAITSLASGTQTFTLARRDAAAGTRLIYLPGNERRAYSIEFRPGSGADTGFLNKGTAGDWKGVFVRASYVRYLSRTKVYLGWKVLPPKSVGGSTRYALDAGDTLRLSDDSTVTVEATTATTATVKVVRPVDSTNPPAPANALTCTYGGQPPCDITNYSGDGSESVTVTVDAVDNDGNGDNLWTSSFEVKLDDVVVHTTTYENPGGMHADVEPRVAPVVVPVSVGIGEHTVTVTRRDLAGNESSQSYSVKVRSAPPATLPPSDVDVGNVGGVVEDPTIGVVRELRVAKRTRTSASLTWLPPASGTAIDYEVYSAQQSKRYQRIRDGVSSATGVTIRKLRPGTKYFVYVIAISSSSRSDEALTTLRTRGRP